MSPSALLLSGLAFALPLWFLPFSYDSFTLPKALLLGLGALAAACLRVWEETGSGQWRNWSARDLLWLCLLGALAASYAASPWREAGFDALALAAGWLLAGLAAGRALRSTESKGLAATAAAAAAAVAAAWAFRRGLVPLPGVWSPLGHYNHLASYLAGCGPLLLWRLSVSKGRPRWAWGAAFLVVFVALIALGSRGAWLAAAVSWPLALKAAFPGNLRSIKPRPALAAAAALAALFWLVKPYDAPAGRFVLQRAADGARLDSMALRYRRLLWNAAARMTAERPLLGQGPGGFHYRYLEHQARILEEPGGERLARYWQHAHSAHNIFLHQAADGGLLGLSALLALLGAAALGWRRAREPAGESALRDCWAYSALALLVDGTLSLTLQLPASAFLLALGLGAASGAETPAGGSAAAPTRGAGALSLRPRLAACSAALLLALPIASRLVLRQASEVQVGWAMAFIARQDPVSAEAALRKAVEWSPANGRASFFQGNALLLLGEPEAAARSLERAMRLDPDPNVPYDLALAHLERGDSSGARRWCAFALRLKPVFPELFATLGYLSRKEGKPKEAETWLVRSLEAAEDPAVMKELGLLYRETGRKRDAAALLSEVARRYPQDEETLQALRELESPKAPVRRRTGGGSG